MQSEIHSTLALFPFSLCVTCAVAATPFSLEAGRPRLAPGQSATLTAGGTNCAIPGWNVIAGGCTGLASGGP